MTGSVAKVLSDWWQPPILDLGMSCLPMTTPVFSSGDEDSPNDVEHGIRVRSVKAFKTGWQLEVSLRGFCMCCSDRVVTVEGG